MDWLFENLGKLAPVVIFILYMISSMKKGGQDEDEAPDPEAAERARKIQEEIRRKILERQRGSELPTGRPPIQFEEEEDAFEEPVYQRPVRETAPEPEPVLRSDPRPAPVAKRDRSDDFATPRVDPFLEKRRQVEAQLEEAKRQRAAALEKAMALRKRKATVAVNRPTSIASGEIRGRLKTTVGDRASLRTAIVLKEVLDTPLGLR